MAMPMGPASAGEDEGIISAINTTPLVDVMLVLLIVFLIAIPVVTQTAPVALPHETNRPRDTQPQNINVAVTRDGRVFWNLTELPDQAALASRLAEVASASPQPGIQIHGDGDAPYEHVGRLVLACQHAGIQKLAFITEPPRS